MRLFLSRYLPIFIILALVVSSAGIGLAQSDGDVVLPLCSATVHGKYVTTAPDGKKYPTWHPQIDPVTGCHFDHEHGSNPAFASPNVGWNNPVGWPAFGYTASQVDNAEGHAGFKVYVLELQGLLWTITQHMGTANAVAATCNRFHTLDIQARDGISGTLLVDVHMLADFGVSRAIVAPNEFLSPIACPGQSKDIPGGRGVRYLPIASLGTGGGENWQVISMPGNVLNFVPATIAFIASDAQTACDTIACTVNIKRDDSGTTRQISFGPGFGFTEGGLRGEFYTDPQLKHTAEGGAGLVRQYITPDFTFVLTDTARIACSPYGAEYYYLCGSEYIYRQTQYLHNPLITGNN